MPETIDLNQAVFGKTALGQQEIQSRSLNLSPLVRRVLVLVDGKRSGAELSVFLVGKGEIDVVLAGPPVRRPRSTACPPPKHAAPRTTIWRATS